MCVSRFVHVCLCRSLFLPVHVSATRMCRQEEVCMDRSSADYPTHTHTHFHQTVQKPHHRRLQCPPPSPPCTSPEETQHVNTYGHKHTGGHITSGRLPCLPTSIHTLRPRGPVAEHTVLITEAACTSNARLPRSNL